MTDNLQHDVYQFHVELLKDGPDRQQWAKVSMNLKRKDGDTVHGVTVAVLVPDEPAVAISDVKQKALESARQILRDALSIFEVKSAAELKALQWEREEAGYAKTMAPIDFKL